LPALDLDRPSSLPQAAIYPHPAPFASTSRQDKLAAVRQAMQQHGADYHFISTLDDIAWLLNLRGADVNYNPVFISHLLLARTAPRCLSTATKWMPAAGRTGSRRRATGRLPQRQGRAGRPCRQTMLLDPRRITLGFIRPCRHHAARAGHQPQHLAESLQDTAEAEHIRNTMEQDGAALCEFFAWFEQAVNREAITELSIDEQITAARARRPGFVSPSFATIAGFNANGALPHYRATEQAHASIAGNGLLLIDSGGQYHGGTTDITRVVAVGTPSRNKSATSPWC
jgi:Xaa-Pro aminopeptidase